MEGISQHKPENIEREPDPFLEELWERYEFPGTPPFKDSVSEGRLKQACRDYAGVVNNLQSSHLLKRDSENYIPPQRAVEKISSYDSKRREIHNQIALMVMGRQRSGMDSTLAEHIADFALEYAES